MKVIKLGGSLLDDAARRAEVLAGIAASWNAGDSMVLVHGGGKHIDTMLKKLGIEKRTYAGLRVTDDATLDVVVAILSGSVNKMLVSELTALGVTAAGVSGADAATIVAEPHPPIDGVDLGHVGQVVDCDDTLIAAMLANDILPVVSSVAMTHDGALLNVNADSAAAALAAACGAASLQFITDVDGLLDATGSVVPSLTATDAHALLATEVVRGGMRPKLVAALGALDDGVDQITIGTTILEGTGTPDARGRSYEPQRATIYDRRATTG